MEIIYPGIVVFLFILAAVDLMVGVSNDAVNFLSSAVGSKIAPLRVIMLVAAAGILCGALFSNGMMEIARHGILRPEQFAFREVMCVFLAVMVADVIILDVFNTLGLPTSTTVSMVFELLGGAFAIALVKVSGDSSLHLADCLNTDKALSVITGIFLSVAVAFIFGTVTQWLARLLFTFRPGEHMKWSIGLFGGVACTAIIYFMLIKGAKEASFMTPDMKSWIAAHTGIIVAACLVLFTAVSQILHKCRINVFKFVVLLGTFALAMAFAGNDLVNFIGVPLAGYAAWHDYAVNGGGDPGFLMTSLSGPARTPVLFLAAAGIIMIVSLMTSKKAKNVIRTSVDLSRQDEGEEMFGSSAAARGVVRSSLAIANAVSDRIPHRMKSWIDGRFRKEDAECTEGAAFDAVRASVNLLVASLLIALGTSLKLPLSTTYVTFMVAMGTSLADRAWGRDSAVFRITGVLSVIGGWFVTAGAAFTACFLLALAMYYGGAAAMGGAIVLAVFLLFRSRHSLRKPKYDDRDDVLFAAIRTEENEETVWFLLKRHVSNTQSGMLDYAAECYPQLTNGLIREDRRSLRRLEQSLDHNKNMLRQVRRRELTGMRRIDRSKAMEKNMWFHLANNACQQLNYALKRSDDLCLEHVGNNFAPLSGSSVRELGPIRDALTALFRHVGKIIADDSYENMEGAETEIAEIERLIRNAQSRQLADIQNGNGSVTAPSVYIGLLQESLEMTGIVRRMLEASRNFGQ